MQSLIIKLAAIFGILAISIGAFGAHVFKTTLINNNTLSAFNTAVQYHFYHTLALLFLAFYASHNNNKHIKRSAISFSLGIILFSGSLYTLAITGIKTLGAITPLGGIAFIIGWIFLFLSTSKNQKV
jgi:uncharacterized membrane protein YgdD (TMEM256/DUF423 family)